MSDFMLLEKQLQQLGRELTGTSDVANRVMAGISQRVEDDSPWHVPTRHARLRWRLPAAVAASLAVCLGMWWFTRPTTLYARMLAALAEVRTVHATGWTRQIVRKWPLEKPAGEAANQRFELELWQWTDPDGTHRSYERQGPVIAVRREGKLKEYQADADLTFVFDGRGNKDRVARFGRWAEYLVTLKRPSLTKEELGTREENGRTLRGIRHIEGDRIEDIWIDQQASLPVRISRRNKNTGQQMMELVFAVDQPVPEAIAAYEPPQTKYVRQSGGGKGNEEWRQHVRDLGERLEVEPISGRMAIVPRKDGRTFTNQWPLVTSAGNYWVRPLDADQYQPMTMAYFIRRHAATADGERRHGTWRLAKELHDVELPRADLVHKADVPWQEWVQFVLNEFGFEFVEQVEEYTIWIARHDGRELKPWQDVKPPVPYVVEGGVEKKGYVKPGIGFTLHPVTMNRLLVEFNRIIDDRDFAADKPWIIDETHLPAPPPFDESQHGTRRQYSERVLPAFYVATDCPWFVGQESLEMAREWYAKEFGITFIEDTRSRTVHVIRRKK